MGEFDHKMDQPFLQFLNGLTDLLIITAIIESVTGKELITGEDLTDLERGMKCVGAIVDAVSIGTAILTGGGSITLKSALRVWISELVTDASTYTVGYVGEQLGLPPAVTLILSLGVGSFVGYKMGKWAVEGIDGKVYTSGGNESGRISNLDDGLNFSNSALEHMGESGRQVPIQTLQDAIRYGEAMPDPRGSNATMYYTTMYKNGKMYNLEVLYDEISNTVYHFEYARKAMGNLPAIPK